MSNVFEHYEADYHSSTRTAAQNIEKLPALLPGHEKAELTNATAKAIDAAEDIVKQMELEARSLQGEERQTAVAQAKDYKASISVLKEQLKLAKNSNRAEEAARAQLFQQSNPAHMAESETQRSRLLAANSKMGKASDKLKAACQIAGEQSPPARLPACRPRTLPAPRRSPRHTHSSRTHPTRGSRHGASGHRHSDRPQHAEADHPGRPQQASMAAPAASPRLAPPRRPRRSPQPSALATPRPAPARATDYPAPTLTWTARDACSTEWPTEPERIRCRPPAPLGAGGAGCRRCGGRASGGAWRGSLPF